MENLKLESVDVDGAVREAADAVAGDTRLSFLRKGAVAGGAALSGGAILSALIPAGAIYFQMDEPDVQRIMAHRLAMIGSDGLPHDSYPHPRLWGTFPRVLGHYARDLKLFSLEEAVRKMTGHTASVFGMVDRGVIREGAYADLVLFDPATVRDASTYDAPTKVAEGILETWINGQSAYVFGEGATEARAGRLVTRGRE